MSDHAPKESLRYRIKWLLFGWSLRYCVRCMHPDADANDYSFIDNANFVAVSRDEIAAIIEEAPAIAWRFRLECAGDE